VTGPGGRLRGGEERGLLPAAIRSCRLKKRGLVGPRRERVLCSRCSREEGRGEWELSLSSPREKGGSFLSSDCSLILRGGGLYICSPPRRREKFRNIAAMRGPPEGAIIS